MQTSELFRENLRTMRHDSGLTQQKLADRAGITVTSLRDYETGRRSPPMEVMGQIATALGIKVSDLFHDPTTKTEAATVKILPSKLMQKLASIPDDVYEAIFQAGELSEEDWGYIKDVAENAKERNKSKHRANGD